MINTSLYTRVIIGRRLIRSNAKPEEKEKSVSHITVMSMRHISAKNVSGRILEIDRGEIQGIDDGG